MPPVGALKWNDALRIAAMTHAVDLGNSGTYSHTGTDGSLPPIRAQRAGYPTPYVGENVANRSDLNSALQDFLNSPEHCKNMMNSRYTETGAANFVVGFGYFVNKLAF